MKKDTWRKIEKTFLITSFSIFTIDFAIVEYLAPGWSEKLLFLCLFTILDCAYWFIDYANRKLGLTRLPPKWAVNRQIKKKKGAK